MILKIKRIFQRYAHENVEISSQAPNFYANADLRIERISLNRNRLNINGWTSYDEIGLLLNRSAVWSKPDPACINPENPRLHGFSISVPFELGALQLVGRQRGQEVRHKLPNVTAWQFSLARAKLVPGYICTLFSLLPQLYLLKRTGDLSAREIIKEKLNLIPKANVLELQAGVFAAKELNRPHKAATLVLPIYNALEDLTEALWRIETYSELPLHLILVEDSSPDPAVRPFVQAWAAAPERRFAVTLLLNEVNLGFIGSTNRGMAKAMEIAPEQPVILFNSDAMVAKDWVSRLLSPLADPSVASVTPMSNDAEIFNAPVICQRHDLTKGMVEKIDEVASRLSPEAFANAPTGVGFCMALAPQFLAKIPQFDTAFGRGYGEENDWCLRAARLGGKNLGIGNLFVEHRGGSSFGSQAKQMLIAKNVAELVRRHPSYPEDVQHFIRHDPMATARLALGMAWAGQLSQEPVTLWLAHSLGGGADHDLMRRIKTINAQGQAAVVLRIGQPHRWRLELHTPFGISQGSTNDFDLIKELVALLPKRRVIYSCGVGDRDPVSLPAHLAALAGYHLPEGPAPLADGQHPIEVWFHDFFPISPSYNLLNADGSYHGAPLGDGPASSDRAHLQNQRGALPAVSLAQWQKSWGGLIALAQEVVTFSASSRDLVAAVFPDQAQKIFVRPHELIQKLPKITSQRQKGKVVIGVLGNISANKGAKVLQKLSKQLSKSQDLGLVVIGQFDPAYRLSAPAKAHGSYNIPDLPLLVERYGITAWFIPSVWPETFSFTTHEVISTGMPVFAFDIGAQADAIRPALQAGQKGALLPISQAMNLQSADFLRHLPA